jgi:nicotinamidase/pyrazinamidase
MNILLVVDYQYDFYNPKGSLYCSGGEIIADNLISFAGSKKFDLKIFTQDWHPSNHISYASTHGKEPFTEYKGDILWPDHCIAGSLGSEIPKNLSDKANIIFRKGTDINIDSYSAFKDKNGQETGLNKLFSSHDSIYVCGIATDVCVAYTVKDLLEYSKNIIVVEDLCVGTSPQKHSKAIEDLSKISNIKSFKESL